MKVRFVLTLIALVLSTVAHAGQWVLDGSAAFHADGKTLGGVGASHFDVDGDGVKVAGSAEVLADGTAKVDAIADVTKLDTKIDERTEHARTKFLNVAKFPTLKLLIDPFKLGVDQRWCGKLTMKTETKPVCGVASVEGDDARKTVTASFTMNLDDYPSFGDRTFLGNGIEKAVTVTVKAEAKKK